MTARVEVWMERGWGGRGELGASEVSYASLEPLGSSGSVILFSPHPCSSAEDESPWYRHSAIELSLLIWFPISTRGPAVGVFLASQSVSFTFSTSRVVGVIWRLLGETGCFGAPASV